MDAYAKRKKSRPDQQGHMPVWMEQKQRKESQGEAETKRSRGGDKGMAPQIPKGLDKRPIRQILD